MNKINYQKELDSLIENLVKNEEVPTLLLHSCCAPCSSYVLEYLSQYFKITIFFYNPNIYPMEEYTRRVAEQKGLISEMKVKNEIRFIEGKYDTESFYKVNKGLEEEKEGGVRCFNCYELRLNEAAIMAKEKGYDYFTTTLSISPHKNSAKLNEIGRKLSEKYDVKYLYSDFKKKEGYKRSIELSKQYKLYRQDYCGCVFSKNERMSYDNEKNK
ncbi:epoxyqueuosine reductase QueH [Clostridium beijerinckii]|uniref:Epoxyqueuosine reductase QueH n=1 Tax=Clostridium beijerinckii TaxID=1520 RepID=A0A7X9XQ24_CLOBE|nr:epoxyqueuosine reductase QueH [Clostridium beijerinckii]NMF05536.1 epoxyqueuosine reductase QueH [Clostridium beijerinckii]